MRLRPARTLLGTTALALALTAGAPAPASAHHSVEGTLTGVHADYFDEGSSVTRWRLDTGDSTVDVLPTSLPALSPENAAVAVDDEAGDGVVGPVSSSSPQAGPTLGGRRTAVIAVNFATDLRQPWTREQIKDAVFRGSGSTSAFFREESYDRLWLTGKAGNTDGDVFGWVTIAASPSTCDYTTWAAQAKLLAAASGFSASGYQHVMYVFPYQSSCGWAGLAYMPGTESWINGNLSVRVTGHELSHNLGLHHAGSWACTGPSGQAVAISSNCTLSEYNDPFDVMGAHGSRHSHGWNLQRLGLLQDSNVQTVTASGTYSMSTAFAPTTQPTTLRIPRSYAANGSVQDWYYLEIRSQGGTFDNFSPGDWVVKGVSIRVDDDPSLTTRSRLIDTHPGGSIYDAPLQPGERFSDGNVAVTTLSAGAGAASVAVDLAAPPLDTQPPAAPSNLSAVLLGSAVRLSWAAAADDSGATTYLVHRDGVQVGSSSSTSFDDASVPAGRHVYTVYARDGAGNVSPASAPYVFVVPAKSTSALKPFGARDRTGPRLRLTRRRARGQRLLLSVTARDRAGIARVELRIEGRRARARRADRLSYRWRARPGRHRLVVVAFDKRGNRAVIEWRLRVRA